MAELVPDPGFDNPAAWSIPPGTGGTVSGSELLFVNSSCIGATTIPAIAAKVGEKYTYSIEVLEYAASATTAVVNFGGAPIWNKGTVGTFTGTVEAVSTYGIAINALLTGRWAIGRLSIQNQAPIPPSPGAPPLASPPPPGGLPREEKRKKHKHVVFPYVPIFDEDEDEV